MGQMGIEFIFNQGKNIILHLLWIAREKQLQTPKRIEKYSNLIRCQFIAGKYVANRC